MKSKTYECRYCCARFDTLKMLNHHKKRAHGSYGVKPEVTTRKQLKLKPHWMNGVYYKQKGNHYIEQKQQTNLDIGTNIAVLDDGSYLLKCKNCDCLKRLEKYPFLGLKKNECPVILCPHCGMNLFRDNKHVLKKYIIKTGKTKKETEGINIDYDLVMSNHRENSIDSFLELR